MTDFPDSPDRVRANAIERLRKLGSTEYAACIYVALLRLGSGSASEIAETTSVPRTRVYDGIDALEQRGLVDVQYSSPKVFRPVARETAVRQFRLEYDDTIDELLTQLGALEPTDRRSGARTDVWTVTGRDAITDRASDLIDTAEEEVLYTSTEEALDEIVECLSAADERDATIRLAGLSAPTRERVRRTIPVAEAYDIPWTGGRRGSAAWSWSIARRFW